MSEFWQDFPEVHTNLLKVKQKIKDVNKSSEKYLNNSIDYLLLTGGKMLRPAFCLLSASFGPNYDESKVINLAAAIEMLHLATLIHDDIIDESDVRRNQPTIQKKYSKEYAVYMGDYLFTQCFLMLSGYEHSREDLQNLAKGISKICIGEMMQNQYRFQLQGSVKQYLKIVSGKTAGLFAVSLSGGAGASDAEEKICKQLARIGYNIGMAFQIKDDLLDYSQKNTVGKDIHKDILNGYYTLPVIFALKTDFKSDIEALITNKNISDDDYHQLINKIHQSGAVKKTESLAIKYTQRALQIISDLPDVYGKMVLQKIVPILLERTY